MAKKTRKKAGKLKRAKAKSTRKARPTKRRKTVARKSRPKPAKGVAGQVSRAVDVVIDTVKGTDALRNKYEPRGTSETE